MFVEAEETGFISALRQSILKILAIFFESDYHGNEKETASIFNCFFYRIIHGTFFDDLYRALSATNSF